MLSAGPIARGRRVVSTSEVRILILEIAKSWVIIHRHFERLLIYLKGLNFRVYIKLRLMENWLNKSNLHLHWQRLKFDNTWLQIFEHLSMGIKDHTRLPARIGYQKSQDQKWNNACNSFEIIGISKYRQAGKRTPPWGPMQTVSRKNSQRMQSGANQHDPSPSLCAPCAITVRIGDQCDFLRYLRQNLIRPT
jgi:hypothetical protein